MAHSVVGQTIIDGTKTTVVKYTIKGDGSSGELTNFVLFDASAFKTASTSNKIMEIEYALNGFSAELLWDATTDIRALSLVKDYPYKADFWKIGGLVNNAGTGKTGDILITTTGLSAKAYDGYILLTIFQKDVLDNVRI